MLQPPLVAAAAVAAAGVPGAASVLVQSSCERCGSAALAAPLRLLQGWGRSGSVSLQGLRSCERQDSATAAASLAKLLALLQGWKSGAVSVRVQRSCERQGSPKAAAVAALQGWGDPDLYPCGRCALASGVALQRLCRGCGCGCCCLPRLLRSWVVSVEAGGASDAGAALVEGAKGERERRVVCAAAAVCGAEGAAACGIVDAARRRSTAARHDGVGQGGRSPGVGQLVAAGDRWAVQQR